MEWKIIIKEPAMQLLDSLSENEIEKVFAVFSVLKTDGPNLSRPYSDTLYGSKYTNLKELRVSTKGAVLRFFYVFDAERHIVLCGGNKRGKDSRLFYTQMIALAEQIYDEHLAELSKKGNSDERCHF